VREVSRPRLFSLTRLRAPCHGIYTTWDPTPERTSIWSPALSSTAPPADILQTYEASGVAFLKTEGELVLKVPVRSDTYVRT
jgi:hypothetical protein